MPSVSSISTMAVSQKEKKTRGKRERVASRENQKMRKLASKGNGVGKTVPG